MPKYLLAGLSVDSEVPLPVHSCNYTLETTKTPDLVYRISEQHQNLFENLGRSIETDGLIRVSRMRQFDQVISTTFLDQDAFYLLWNHIGIGYRITLDTAEVAISGVTYINIDYLPWYLLSQVLGFVLHLKGLLCLHASVVEKEGLTVGLLGTNGRGKSTLTASLVRSGWSLVSDDLLCVEDKTLRLNACFPFMKLRHDAIDFLGLHKASQMLITNTDKMKVEVDGSWGTFTDSTSLHLNAIYFVRRFPADVQGVSNIKISHLEPIYAKSCLVSNGFAAGLLAPQHRQDYAARARLLAERVPIRYLNYPSGLDYLETVEEALFADVSGLPVRGRVKE